MPRVRSQDYNNPNAPLQAQVEMTADGWPRWPGNGSSVAFNAFLTHTTSSRNDIGTADSTLSVLTATVPNPEIFAYRAAAGTRVLVEKVVLRIKATGMTVDKFGGGPALANGCLLKKTRQISSTHVEIFDALGGKTLTKNSSFLRYSESSALIDPTGAGADVLVWPINIRETYGMPLVLEGSNPADSSVIWNEGLQIVVRDNMDAATLSWTTFITGTIADL